MLFCVERTKEKGTQNEHTHTHTHTAEKRDLQTDRHTDRGKRNQTHTHRQSQREKEREREREGGRERKRYQLWSSATTHRVAIQLSSSKLGKTRRNPSINTSASKLKARFILLFSLLLCLFVFPYSGSNSKTSFSRYPNPRQTDSYRSLFFLS